MRKKVVKAIEKAAAGKPNGVVKAMKKAWHKTPWNIRHELRKKLNGSAVKAE